MLGLADAVVGEIYDLFGGPSIGRPAAAKSAGVMKLPVHPVSATDVGT